MSTRSRVTPESPLPSSDVDAASIPSVSSYPDQETMETQDLKELLIGRRGLEDSEEMMLSTRLTELLASSIPNDFVNRYGDTD